MIRPNDEMSDRTSICGEDVALISGAAMGIGREFARAVFARGMRLVLVDVQADPLSELTDELRATGPGEVHPFVQNLASRRGPKAVIEFCRRSNLPVTMLINNAAVGVHAPFLEQSLSQFQRMIQVNIASLVTLTRLVLPSMLERESGTIVNVTSISAFESSPGWAVYGATKAFVQNFTESLQHELAGSGIYVTAVCPGITGTNFLPAPAPTRLQMCRLPRMSSPKPWPASTDACR